MRFRQEIIADALRASPPGIVGMLDEQYIRAFLGVQVKHGARVYTFDILGDFTYRTLLAQHQRLVLHPEDWWKRQPLPEAKALDCPSCGLRCVTLDFWQHYNRFHALRAYWINREHWSAFGGKGKWKQPPELE